MSKYNKVRTVFLFKLTFYILLLLIIEINCRNIIKRLKRDAGGEDNSTAETRTESIKYRQYLEDPQILNYGRYTPQSFHYVNFQDVYTNRTEHYEVCVDQYIKCTLSLEAPTPVCVYNLQRNFVNTRYTTLETYCDAYLENCRVGLRYYKMVNYGECKFENFSEKMKKFFTWSAYKGNHMKDVDSYP